MIALDTNALVRMLVEDDTEQAKIIQQLVSFAEQKAITILVLPEVLLETVWVLEAVYSIKRACPGRSPAERLGCLAVPVAERLKETTLCIRWSPPLTQGWAGTSTTLTTTGSKCSPLRCAAPTPDPAPACGGGEF